jgi:hypothetical protein
MGGPYHVTAKRISVGLYSSSRWGNALSPYWMARALARMLNVDFTTGGFAHASWMRHLPTFVPRDPNGKPRYKDFARLCEACRVQPDNWGYAHRCATFFVRFIFGDIVRDTRAAMLAHVREGRDRMPDILPGDVVINDRCAQDAFLSHTEYGPIAFSFYEAMPQNATRILVCNAHEHLAFPPCRRKMDSFLAWLRRRYPRAEVVEKTEGIFESFARLVFSPIVFNSASTWTLWSVLANNGTVHSTPLPFYLWNASRIYHVFDGASNWRWDERVPVLLGERPAQLVPGLSSNRTMAVEQALRFLETH